jgi:anti-sigma-K factor RskA
MSDGMHITDLSASYALGALAPGEQATVEQHCAGCAECRADVLEMTQIASALPLACESVAPSAVLRDRIMDAARANESPGRINSTAPSIPRSLGRPQWQNWVAGLATAAAIVMGVLAMQASQQRDALAVRISSMGDQIAALQQTNDQLSMQAEQGHAVMTALASGTYWAMGPQADRHGGMWHYAVVQPPQRGHNGMLLATVPEVPRGMAYQVWVVRGGRPHPAGAVMHGGMTMMDMKMPLLKGDVVAFSMEPMPGNSPAPTSPYLVRMPI